MASERGSAAFYDTALNSPDPTIVSDNHKSRVVDRSNVAAEENSKQYQKAHYRRQWDGTGQKDWGILSPRSFNPANARANHASNPLRRMSIGQ